MQCRIIIKKDWEGRKVKKLNGLIQRELRKLYLRFSYVCINIMPHYNICRGLIVISQENI